MDYTITGNRCYGTDGMMKTVRRNDMEHIEIREMMPEDAEELIACMKKTGGETDNLTFGEKGKEFVHR